MPTHAELVTPERVLFEGEAEFVVMRTEGGEVMFLPHHADFVGAVDICVVRIATGTGSAPGDGAGGAHGSGEGPGGGHELRAAVHGGFVHVADNRVTVLASVAEPADEIDVERARHALEAATAEIASAEEAPAAAPQPAAAEAAEHPAEASLEESPTMLALLHPESPDVRRRRAEARLEATGALERPGSAPAP